MKRFNTNTGRKVKRNSTTSHYRINPGKTGSLKETGTVQDSTEITSNKFTNLKSHIMNIIGRLTKDAQVYTTAKDKQVVNFTVAVNDSYRNKQGQRIVQTSYFDCAYWLTPNVAPMLTKGSLVELIGRVSARAWEGKDGQPQAGLNFHTSQIKFYGGSKKSQSSQDSTEIERNKVVAYEATDDLPF